MPICRLASRDYAVARGCVEKSRRLVRVVMERNVGGGTLRASRSEARISRSLTLVLESSHRSLPTVSKS
jgi:hypothetical protein